MAQALPSYENQWRPLSAGHVDLDNEIQSILSQFKLGDPALKFGSWAVVGTFGAGKTQCLYHIFRGALTAGLIPMYVLAENLFSEILTSKSDQVWLPGDVAQLVKRKVQRSLESALEGDLNAVKKIFPTTNIDVEHMLQLSVDAASADPQNYSQIVLLVDELETHYESLRRIVQADERSPLREWLGNLDDLKFVALAPAGIYEMGGADHTRVGRLVLPPVDPFYVRKEFLADDAGKANSAWWLARGKPRHLSKAIDVLVGIPDEGVDSHQIVTMVRERLDHIGQEPSRVPAAVLDSLTPAEYVSLVKLCPAKARSARRLVFDLHKYDVGDVGTKLLDHFNGIDGTTATLIASYLRTLLKSLSDQDGIAVISLEDFPELLQIALDVLLEYEHASPGVSEKLSEIMQLYQAVNEPMVTILANNLADLREIDRCLPLSCRQLRDVFPFPVMNPIVRGHVPADIMKRLEGKGLPIWHMENLQNSVYVFASGRDLENFVAKDAFRAAVIPDGRGALCLIPSEVQSEPSDPLFKWLKTAGKTKIEHVSPLLMNFLLSIAGEIDQEIPGALGQIMKQLIDDVADPITSRKVQVYQKAFEEIIASAAVRAPEFCGPLPSDAATVWGRSQIADRTVAVYGCALAYVNLSTEEIDLAIRLRELFRGGREGRGSGPLRALILSRGLPTLVNDLLPATRRRGSPPERQAIQRLRQHHSVHRDSLRDLALSVPLQDFIELHSDEDQSRVLESFWRAIRGEFDKADFDESLQRLMKEVVPTVQKAVSLETRAIQNFGIHGLDFGDREDLVRNLIGLTDLVTLSGEISKCTGSGASLLAAICSLLLNRTLESVDSRVRGLATELHTTETAINQLATSAEDLPKNYAEYQRAAEYANIDESEVNNFVDQTLAFGDTYTLEDLREEAFERSEELKGISDKLETVDRILEEIESALGEMEES